MRFIATLRTAILALLVVAPVTAQATLKVVTTTEDLAAIAREVGGARVQVDFMAHGYEDPHHVDAKPSFVLKLAKADVFIQIGRELEIGWVPPLLNNARNAKIQPGGAGFLDVSSGVKILEVPTGTVDRSMGDVHPFGNPHFWLSSDNAVLMAQGIAAKFAQVDPAGAAVYKAGAVAFAQHMAAAKLRWTATAKQIGLTGANIVTYHNSWPYFAREFGCHVIAYVEPRPGIPPSVGHTADLIAKMKAQHVRVLLVEPYFDQKLPRRIGANAGVPVVMLPPSMDGSAGMKTFSDLFDRQLQLLAKAMGGK